MNRDSEREWDNEGVKQKGEEKAWDGKERARETSRHLLRRYSPPVSVNAIFEVQHSQPPDVHIQHVVIEDILWGEKIYICLANIVFVKSNKVVQVNLRTDSV